MPKGSTKTKHQDRKDGAQAQAPSATHDSTSGPVQGPSYAEIQDDEVEVLKAIYADGFEELQTKAAWSKTHEKSFRLRLTAYSDQKAYLSLLVTLTATYPKTLPMLKIESSNHVPDDVLRRLREILVTKPQELLGEVMIYEIASAIQDALEDAVSAVAQKETKKAVVPSLEEERAAREVAASREATEREQASAREQQAAIAEEERKRQARIDEEIKRREKERMKRRSNIQQGHQSDDDALPAMNLDQVCTQPLHSLVDIRWRLYGLSIPTITRPAF